MEKESQHQTQGSAGLDENDELLIDGLRALSWLGIVLLGLLPMAVVILIGFRIPVDSDYTKGIVAVLLFTVGVSLVLPRIQSHGWKYFLGAETVEREKVDRGEVKLCELQNTAWTPRAARATTYSAVSLGMILVAAVLLLAHQEEVGGAKRNLFLVVLVIASISVVLYGVSLQFWEEAIGRGYHTNATFLLRDWALALSSLGLLSLVTSMALAIIVINTVIGAVVGGIGVLAALFTVEFKWQASKLGDNDPMPKMSEWFGGLRFFRVLKRKRSRDKKIATSRQMSPVSPDH